MTVIRFNHSLNPWRATARSLGVVLAALTFLLLGQAVAAVGPLTPLAILLTGLLVLINNLGYAELADSVARPGGAYALVHAGQNGGGLAFLTGWAAVLSGLGLTGLLAQGAARHLSSLLADLLGLEAPVGLLGMALVALATLDGCLGGRRRRPHLTLVLVVSVLLLAWVVGPAFPGGRYSSFTPRPDVAIPLLLVSFAGIEILTGHQRELRRRAVNLPRGLLGTPLLAAVLAALVAEAVGAAALLTPGTPLAPLGTAFAGGRGREGVLALGLVALFFSARRMLAAVVVHLYEMGRDGFWPAGLLRSRSRAGAPARLLLIAGLAAMSPVWMPAGLLSRVAGLLYLFTLMAVNLTLARRPRPLPPHPFTLPFHPWVPALTLAIDFLLLPLWDWKSFVWMGICLAVGGAIYLAYGRGHHIKAREGVTVFRPATERREKERFLVLVPVSNPATAGTLIRLAGMLAQGRGGDVLALQIVVVAEPVPLESGRWRAQAGQATLEKALAAANEEGFPVQTMTRVARSVAQGILDAAADEGADIIVLGWQGPARSHITSLGAIVDAVLRDAPCDVVILRGDGIGPVRRILVPTAGGPHARTAARLALWLADSCGAEVTLLGVQPEPASDRQLAEMRRRVADTLAELAPDRLPKQKIVTAVSVVEGIVAEAREYDLVLLGVSEENLLDRLVFGSVPLQVALRVPTTALVQGYRGLTGLWTRRVTHALFEFLPALTTQERAEVRQLLSRGAQPGVNYFVMTVLSCVIAALGLLLNSPAVVIGAMLVAPLMSPIMAFSLGLVLGNLRLIRLATESILKGVALAILIAAFIGLLSPLKAVTDEMLARGQPTLLDMAVALASGMAGAYALARKDVSAALPGVAIAAALMPPLATVGLGLALGAASVAGGAFLLFITNIAAISLAGGVVFLLLGVRPQSWGPESRRRLRQRLAASLFLLLTIAVPLGMMMAHVAADTARKQAAWETLDRQLEEAGGQLVDLEVERLQDASLHVVATVRSTRRLDRVVVDGLAASLSRRLGRPVRLDVAVMPVISAQGGDGTQ